MLSNNQCTGCRYQYETSLADMGIITDTPQTGDMLLEWCEIYNEPMNEKI